MRKLVVKIRIMFDDEAGVYVGSADNLPGVVAEASSLDGLLVKLRDRIPEMYEANKHLIDPNEYVEDDEFPVEVLYHDFVKARRGELHH